MLFSIDNLSTDIKTQCFLLRYASEYADRHFFEELAKAVFTDDKETAKRLVKKKISYHAEDMHKIYS